MIRACYYLYVAAILLFLIAASGAALAETEGQPAPKNAAMEKRIKDAADKAAANEIAVKNSGGRGLEGVNGRGQSLS